jgi:predicted outer membrane repeat protein
MSKSEPGVPLNRNHRKGAQAMSRRRLVTVWSPIVLALSSVGVVPAAPPASATTTLTVTSCSDSGAGSLRQAVQSITSGQTGIINFSASLGCSTIVTSGISFNYGATVTINGPGADVLAVSGGHQNGVFGYDGEAAYITISGLTIENGGNGVTNTAAGGAAVSAIGGDFVLSNDIFSGNVSGYGGAIQADQAGFTLTNDTFTDNTGYRGGAIWASGLGSTGIGITNSTFTGNTSVTDGGAIYAYVEDVSIQSSTLSTNSAAGDGGAVDFEGSGLNVNDSTLVDNTATNGGAIANDGCVDAYLLNNTLTGNSAQSGGGIYAPCGRLYFGANIVATSSGGDCVDSGGPDTDLGYNLFDDGSCGISVANHDLPNTNPQLDPAGLQDNGGPTQTIALEPDSPAIGYVTDASDCPPTDQRGYPVTVPCDIGAYDTTASPPAATPEVGLPLVFPLVGLALGTGGFMVIRRRRRAGHPS